MRQIEPVMTGRFHGNENLRHGVVGLHGTQLLQELLKPSPGIGKDNAAGGQRDPPKVDGVRHVLVHKTPTVHSLRHTYVVTKMNEWMTAGKNFDALVPYLSRYLGHTSVDETQYYYHQVISAFEILRRHDCVAERVIPGVIADEE